MSGRSEDTARRGYRFPAGVVAEIREGDQTFTCDAQNLSRSGVLLAGSVPTPSADTVKLTLKAPAGGLEVRLAGRVIRVAPDPENDEIQIALQFVDLDDSQREAIEALLARLLQQSQNTGLFDALKPGAPAHEIKKALEAVPLPQRISLASHAGTKEREYLRLDSSPAVLDALVRNPNLAVAEARAIAVSPHLATGTIDILAHDSRFRSDEPLRTMLATHPRASMPTAEALTANLKGPELRKVLSKPGLNPTLRDKLLRRLGRG